MSSLLYFVCYWATDGQLSRTCAAERRCSWRCWSPGLWSAHPGTTVKETWWAPSRCCTFFSPLLTHRAETRCRSESTHTNTHNWLQSGQEERNGTEMDLSCTGKDSSYRFSCWPFALVNYFEAPFPPPPSKPIIAAQSKLSHTACTVAGACSCAVQRGNGVNFAAPLGRKKHWHVYTRKSWV